MKILLLIPPSYIRPDLGTPVWATREYKDGFFNEPHNPYLAASILGVLRAHLPEAELHVLDAQLDNLDFETVRSRIMALTPDLILTLLNFACLDQDRRYTDLPFTTLAINQAYLDHAEAVELYDLRASCYTKTEIEYTVLEAARELASTGRIDRTAGLLIRQTDGAGATLRDTGDRPLKDLSEFPFPAFDLLPTQRYMQRQFDYEGTRYVFLYTTRGCPFGCTFCQAGTKAYRTVRKKTPEQVLAEIEYFLKLGLDHFYFYDDEFAIDMNRAKEICRLILSRELNIRFACYNTTNLVDEELVQLLSQAGCRLIRYGLETGDMDIQQAMKTYVNEEELVRAFDLTHRYGLFVDAFVMVGLPGETPHSLKKTLSLLKRVRPDRITTSILLPKPYSVMYRELKHSGRLLEPYWHRHLFSEGLTYVHDSYRSRLELRRAEKWIRTQYSRFAAWDDLVRNRTGKNLYTRLVRYAGTFPPARAAIDQIKDYPALVRPLKLFYQPTSKFEV
ncbi:MAG: B12-binding domain-containing radical SAM protein [Nitrospirae bacterium]|nr:B12-binding domain-containing radical SAM protein [Nitrospirota bacterium]